jgi:hypothetical protein
LLTNTHKDEIDVNNKQCTDLREKMVELSLTIEQLKGENAAKAAEI